jgi:hypothetical protein
MPVNNRTIKNLQAAVLQQEWQRKTHSDHKFRREDGVWCYVVEGLGNGQTHQVPAGTTRQRNDVDGHPRCCQD